MTLSTLTRTLGLRRLMSACTLGLSLCAAPSSWAGGLVTAPPAASVAASTASTDAEQKGVETVEYNPDDPAIQAAVKAARQTLPAFFKATSTPSSLITNVAVKVEVRDGKVREYIWIMPFQAAGKGFEGQVNDIPHKVRKVITGQQLRFTQADIVDWTYTDLHQHRMFGNYTTCALLRRAPAEERLALKRAMGLDCDKP